MNNVCLMGRLATDPEVRYTAGDDSKAVATYSLAVDRRGKDAGADFFRISAFGKAAEFCEKYLKKGMKIALTGRLQQDTWTTKDGQKRSEVKVIANEHFFCEKKDNGDTALKQAPEEYRPEFTDLDSEELPFNF